MNKRKRTYLQMQLEEATLESGRYNGDYANHPAPSSSSLLDNYRKALAASGAPLSDQPNNDSKAGLLGGS